MSPRMNTSNLLIVSSSVGMAVKLAASVMFVRLRKTLGRVCTSEQNSRSGSLAEEAVDQGPVFRPQRALHVQARGCPARPPSPRPTAGCSPRSSPRAPAGRGPCRCAGPLTWDGTRSSTCCEPSTSSSVSSLVWSGLAVFFQDHLDHAAAQPDGVDQGHDAGHVVEHHAVGAVDAGDHDVAIVDVALEARADPHRMDHLVLGGGDLGGLLDRVVDAVGEKNHRLQVEVGREARPQLDRPTDGRGLAVGNHRGQVLHIVQPARLLGKGHDLDVEVLLVVAAPLPDQLAGLVEAGHLGGVVGDAHRGRVVQQEDHRPLGLQVLVVAEDRTKQQQHDDHDGDDPQQQQRLPLAPPQRAEGVEIEDRDQQDRHGQHDKHGAEPVALFERNIKHRERLPAPSPSGRGLG